MTGARALMASARAGMSGAPAGMSTGARADMTGGRADGSGARDDRSGAPAGMAGARADMTGARDGMTRRSGWHEPWPSLGDHVADFEGRAAVGGQPGAVGHAGRTAGVGAFGEGLVQADVVQRALEDVDLLPEVVALHTGGAGVCPRIEAQNTRRHAFVGGIGRQDALEQSGHDAAQGGRPANVGDREKLALVFGHVLLCPQTRNCVATTWSYGTAWDSRPMCSRIASGRRMPRCEISAS